MCRLAEDANLAKTVKSISPIAVRQPRINASATRLRTLPKERIKLDRSDIAQRVLRQGADLANSHLDIRCPCKKLCDKLPIGSLLK